MTIEQLETLAAGMYRASEDAIPGTSQEGREDWIARKIEHAIQYKTPLLKKLLATHNREELYRLINSKYEDFTYGMGDDGE
ncbi:MAG: hypothetical protein LUD02_10280 [Tannerellaceae bacterium]|nr:hypothetical protein [Tannerellaceae bacterium]MCD8264463.1 hypothetical protein [Tannerellaceae bacterium]